MKRACYKSAGFTLIEMIIVLLLLALFLGMAAPQLRGWGRGAKLRDAADQLLAATLWAQSQAVATATTYRLEIESGGAGYRVRSVSGDEAQFVDGALGQRTTLPQQFHIEVEIAAQGELPQGMMEQSIDFFPTGRLTPATMRIVSEDGSALAIASATPAEPFRLVKGGR